MKEAIIAGLDEAGRGCLAGPVVAGACVVEVETCRPSSPWQLCHAERSPERSGGRRRSTTSCRSAQDDTFPIITDSKKMTEEQRNSSFIFIKKNFPCGIGVAPASYVDEHGILGATELAMHQALFELEKIIKPTYLLIDGRDHFWFDVPHSSIIRGDEKELCIAAASILAKVTRDRLMVEYDMEYPGYGFAEHKGYGTDFHRKTLERKGLTPLHRKSFLSKVVPTV